MVTVSRISKIITACLVYSLAIGISQAQVPDPNQGLRANWLRGTWGINWKPVDLYNGGHEGLSIEPFLNQISHLKTIDYIQVHLGESSIKSPVHMGPHPLLESFWEGDTDTNGNPINLIVPRESYGEDPFLEIVKDIRAAGMKIMVYVNSSNMLSRDGVDGGNPASIPNITERWKAWCDTDPEAQAFIASQPYHTGVWDATSGTYINAESDHPERKYMFCYAEFILKVYAIRYGDLLDSWCFDSGSWMVKNGDNATNGVYEDQMIYNAFKAACHAGNPNAAISFQNSPERQTEELNPFSEAVHADDFMFGHPYNGGRDGGSHTVGNPPMYDRNYAHIEKMKETNGNIHSGVDPQTWTWDDKVVGHYDPPMSTSSWNGGNTPALTDDEFNLWNLEAVQNGGAISWGLPLAGKSGSNDRLVARDWALAQLNGMDNHLMELESPGSPNWARACTFLPDAIIGDEYSHTLVEGEDFWDPEGDDITRFFAVNADVFPSWFAIEETEPGTWTLSGIPTETSPTDYNFRLRVTDASGGTNRWVELNVKEKEIPTNALVQIQATANTDYGINQVATMISDIQTAPDGIATYQISIGVIPTTGKAIVSGSSNGSSTSRSFATGTGPGDNLFTGSNEDEWIDEIGNIEIVNFNANGSSLTEEGITASFASVVVANAQSTNDNVSLAFGEEVVPYGKTPENDYTLDLEFLNGGDNVNAFSIGTGNTSATNKWSINGVNVFVEFDFSGIITSVEESSLESQITLHPNPANNLFSISGTNNGTYELLDNKGKVLLSGNITAENNAINSERIPSGIYFVKVVTDGVTTVEKIVFKQ